MNGDILHLVSTFFGSVPQEKVNHDAVDLEAFMISIGKRFVSQQTQHFSSNQLCCLLHSTSSQRYNDQHQLSDRTTARNDFQLNELQKERKKERKKERI